MAQKKRQSKRRTFNRRKRKIFKSTLKKDKKVPPSILRTDDSTAALTKIRMLEKQRNAGHGTHAATRPILLNSRDPVSVDGDVYMDNNSPVSDYWKKKTSAKDFDPTKKYDVPNTPYTQILSGRVPNKEKTYGVFGDMIAYLSVKEVCLHFCLPVFESVNEFVEVFEEEYGLKGWREVAAKVFGEMKKDKIYFYRDINGVMNFEIRA
ncbi:hypothetical protein THOM_1880 [Trachipleistophora hominis]|uniref:Uncharacterized protein n=1 Tax=Trachipleistophora hominis TaxID=72359 RepID=L7JV31_TRAHO|nr:hypothetical protein THOM_1880 [Trachipleistophora hominis]